MERETGIHGLIRYRYTFRPVIFFESILIGIVAGIVVVAFRLILGKAYYIRKAIYERLADGPFWMLLLWILVLIAVGLFLGWTIQKYPLIRGSGIPQVKGALMRQIKFNWFPEAIFKFIGGVLGIGLGLSMGREGPSVQLGAFVGKGFLSASRYPHIERKYLITSGAAAGLAAAFSAPLAGVIFVLEELHKNFSATLLICSMTASVAADMVTSRFFGLSPVFDFRAITVLPLDRYLFILFLGVVCTFGGILFKKALYLFQDLYVKLKVPVLIRPVFPLLLSIPICFYMFDITGGGHHLIVTMSNSDITVKYLFILLLANFLFTCFCYGSGTAGGIFLPILLMGALVGEIYGTFLFQLGFIDEVHKLNFLILGMAAFFTAVTKAPVTGIILLLEMSGNFNHLLGLVSVCLIAYVFTDLLKSKGVYDELLTRLLQRNPQLYRGAPEKKVVLEIPICLGSPAEHKKIKEIEWPEGSLVVGINRGETELIPRGETEILQGDVLLVLTSEEDAVRYKPILLAMGTEAGES